MSTPTKTSPVGATAKQAGLGVTSGPTNFVNVNPAGHLCLSSNILVSLPEIFVEEFMWEDVLATDLAGLSK